MSTEKPPSHRPFNFWQKLTAPRDVVDLDQRLLSQLLSSALLVTCLLLLVLFALRQPFGVASEVEVMIRIILGVAAGIGYFLSRSGHYKFSARLMIVISLIVLFSLSLVDDNLAPLNYLSVVVLFGSLFLSFSEVVGGAVLTLLALAGFPMLSADLFLREIVDGPISLNATMIVFTLLITYYRSHLEKSKRDQLEHTKLHYQTIADSAYDWIYWVGPDGSYQYVSPSCERILGYTSEEWFANPDLLLERIHPEDKQKWLEHQRLASTSSGLQGVQFRIFHKDGGIRWIEHVCQPIYDKHAVSMGFRASNRDITARLQAQEQLQILSTAVEQSPSSVVITDTNGSIKYVNPKFSEVTGYSLEEAIGQNPRILKSDETPGDTYKDLWETLKAGHEWSGEFINKKKNGEIYWEHASISPVKDNEDAVTHYVAVKEDITERKRVEEELQTYQEQLENLVEERTATLRSANSFLEAEIVERKRIESALRYSEKNLARAQGIANLGSWDWDITRETLTWSDELYRIFGVDKETFELTFDNIANMIHADDRELNDAKVQELLETTDRLDFEFRINRPDGSIRHIYQMAEVTRDSDGKAKRIFGIMMDISERKRIEQALRESERFALSTLDGLSAHIAIVDETGNILAVNRAWRDFAEANASGCLNICKGANYLDVCDLAAGFSSEGSAEFAKGIRAVLDGKEKTFLMEYPCHSPTVERWFVGRVTRFPGDGPPRVVVAHENITERKQIEEALRESEERYRLLAETTRDIILLQDMKGIILYVNRAGADVGGMEMGKLITDFVPAKFLDDLVLRHKAHESGDQDTYLYETALINRDGEPIPVEVNSSPIEIDGETQILIVARDITERKQADEALRASEERYRYTLDNMLEGCQIISHDWRYLYINDAAARQGHRTREQMLGHTIMEVYTDIEETKLFSVLQHCMDERVSKQMVNEFFYSDGTSGWFELSIQPVPEGLFVISNEITKRRQAEEALRESQRMLSTLISNLQGVAYRSFNDREWEMEFISDGCLAMTGYQPDEFVHNRVTSWSDVIHPDDRQMVWDDIQVAIQENRPFQITYRIITRAGLEKWVWEQGRQVHVPGKAVYLEGFVADITERKQAEEDLTQRVRQLELINKVSREITAELELDVVLSKAAQLIHDSFNYPHIGLFLVDSEQKKLVMKARSGAYASLFPPDHWLKLGEGINGWVAQKGERLLIGDVRDEPRYYNPFPEQLILSELSVPLRWSYEVIGVLDIQSNQLDAFDKDDILVLETLADQLATAIQNSSLFEQTQKALDELIRAEAAEREQRTLAEALSNVAAKLTSTLDLEEVLEHILANVGRIALHDSANVMLIESGAARVVRHQGRPEFEDREVSEWIIDETPTLKQMVKSREPLIISETQDSSLWLLSIEWVRSYAGAPIRLDDEVIGFINLNGAEPDMFTAAHAQRLQAFTDQAAIAIKNAQLYHELTVHSEVLEQAVKERTAELQNTKERVEAILTYSPDPILLLKPNGLLEAANPAFQQVFGYHIDQLYGQPPTTLITPEYADAMQEALSVATQKREVARLELIAMHQDETTFDAGVALAPIQVGDMLLGVVCNVRDISAFKEVERMKDAFVSNVSHELRTPITSLKLSHSLLEMDPAGREKYMGRLGREINRLNSLIEDLLRLSRLDQGRVELNLLPIDLNLLAVQYVNDRSLLAESRNVTLLFEGDSNIPLVLADEGLCGQVLSILLTNALNYTPAGGRIKVSTHLEESEGERWIGFSVSDTGPGINQEDQAHLFERFYRGQVGHDSGAPGTGLGLAIAQEIVDLHHGRIEVESDGEPGKGSRFTVWLLPGA